MKTALKPPANLMSDGHVKSLTYAANGGARLWWSNERSGRKRVEVYAWLKVYLASMTKNAPDLGEMALSNPPALMHREHNPESVGAWLETWPLKAMSLPASISTSNTLRILCAVLIYGSTSSSVPMSYYLYDCKAVNTNPRVGTVKVIIHQLPGAFIDTHNGCRRKTGKNKITM